MQCPQEHLKTIVYAKFGGQTKCIMGNSKIENYFSLNLFVKYCIQICFLQCCTLLKFIQSHDTQLTTLCADEHGYMSNTCSLLFPLPVIFVLVRLRGVGEGQMFLFGYF